MGLPLPLPSKNGQQASMPASKPAGQQASKPARQPREQIQTWFCLSVQSWCRWCWARVPPPLQGKSYFQKTHGLLKKVNILFKYSNLTCWGPSPGDASDGRRICPPPVPVLSCMGIKTCSAILKMMFSYRILHWKFFRRRCHRHGHLGADPRIVIV